MAINPIEIHVKNVGYIDAQTTIKTFTENILSLKKKFKASKNVVKNKNANSDHFCFVQASSSKT